MRTLNAHRLLAGTTAHEGYLDALDVGAVKERALRAARDLVRERLRQGLRDLHDRGAASIVEARYLAKAADIGPLRPRFRMQGSMKYRTLNAPVHNPPQEIDVDDGVYLPTSFVTAAGATRPILASRAYFAAVEKILEPLCKERGWILDRSKECCVRIRITDEAHIDLPLYAIPDQEFVRLTEDRAMDSLSKADAQGAELEISEAAYKALPTDQIMLARRNAEWRESDPRQIEDWFLEAIDEHGEAVRNVSRYFKGWRDFKWTKCKISSLLLMTCAVATFDGLRGTLAKDRDDLALLAAARNLVAQLGGKIANPIFADQILNDDWTAGDRAAFVAGAQAMCRKVEAALNGTFNKELAIGHFRAVFGDRVPNSPELISIDGKEDAVLAYPRARVAAPIVPRTTSA